MRRSVSFWTITLLLLTASIGYAQSPTADTQMQKTYPRAGHFALGFELSDFQNDFGLGLQLTSPYFFKNTMAVRAHGGISWLEGIDENDANMEYDWLRYFPVRLGWVISIGLGNGLTRLYGEAGGLMYLGASKLSEDVIIGGYGVFGFEWFPSVHSPVSYFIQAGGMGSSGQAEQLAGHPSIANGFMIDVGIRWYPQK